MESLKQFLSEFPEIGKEQWLEKIRKDLRGKPLEELYRDSDAGFEASPFNHVDDHPANAPLKAESGSWELNESLNAESPGVAKCACAGSLAIWC